MYFTYTKYLYFDVFVLNLNYNNNSKKINNCAAFDLTMIGTTLTNIKT